MLEKLIIRLTEPICVHCPDRSGGRMEWYWRVKKGARGLTDFYVGCLRCGTEMHVPAADIRATLHFCQPSPLDVNENEQAPSEGPPPDRRTVRHSRVFTKFDEALFKKWGISTDGISIAP